MTWRDTSRWWMRGSTRRLSVTRPAYAQMEAKGTNPRVVTLKKIAEAMGVEWEQLRE